MGATLRAPATFTIDPAVHGANSGTVVIAGDLTVNGTTTTINSTTISSADKNITLGAGGTASANDGAGITIDGASASLTYVHSGTKFLFNKDLHITGGVNPTNNLELNTNYRVRWNDSNDYSIMSDSANYIRTYVGGAQILSAESTGILVTGEVDASTLLKVGVNDTEYANNYIRFKPAGAAYIDHNTVGQDINFRVSNASSLDKTPLTLKSDGTTFIDGGNGYFRSGVGNSYSTGWNANSDDHATWINFEGYQGGTTKFRDLRIGNGKQAAIVHIDGSSSNATFSGGIYSGAITSTGDITTNSTTHAYVIINSSATTTASWVYHKQGGTLRWLSGVEGSQSDWQLYSTNSGNTGTRLRVTADGNATFAGVITATTITSNHTLATTEFGNNILKSSKANEQGAFIRMAISTNANPTYAFEDDTDTGMYRSSSNALAFTTGGVQRLLISSAGVTSTTGNLRAGGGLSTSVGTDFGSQQSFWATAGGSTHQAGYTIGWNTGANNGRTQKMYLDNNGNLNVTGSITAGTAGVTTQDHRVPAGAGYITYSPGNASADVLNIRKYGTVQQKFDQ